MKTCTRCGVAKAPEDFYRNGGDRPGLSSWCKHCKNTYRKVADRSDKGKQLRFGWRLKWQYHISPEQYEQLLVAQGGGCALCGKVPARQSGIRLAVDHDHSCCPAGRACPPLYPGFALPVV